MANAKIFKVDNVSVTVFGTAIDGVTEIQPPQAHNREKDTVLTVEGVVGFSSKLIAGETEFKITSMSNQYHWLCGLVDTVDLGTIVFQIPGATYTMYNATISSITTDSVKDSTPEVTVKVMYCKVDTSPNGYVN